MTDADLWRTWGIWLGVAAVIIVVAAALLITIWLTARGILAHAVRALNAAEKIRENTLPIWALGSSNEAAEKLLETITSIEQKGGKLAEALCRPPAAAQPLRRP
jgi:hypothetical protein